MCLIITCSSSSSRLIRHIFQVIISPLWLKTSVRLKYVFQVMSLFWHNTISRLRCVFQDIIGPFLLSTSHRLRHGSPQLVTSPFCLNLLYIISLSLLGFLLLIALPMKDPAIPRSSHLDFFFMSVSATTISSMDTVEMESFSSSQLLVLAVLMLLSGEVFTSMLGLLIRNHNSYSNISDGAVVTPHYQEQEVELGMVVPTLTAALPSESVSIKQDSLRCLLYVVLGYLILVHATGSVIILVYLNLFPNSRAVLKRKGIQVATFTIFITVSSFSNGGFVPTNENMEVFKTCSGILLTVGCLVLLGNTMYPLGLRLAVWVLKRLTEKEEFEFILRDDQRRCLGYDYHLLSGWLEAGMLGVTECVFVLVQALLFCCLEWKSVGLEGMNTYQKVLGSLFMSVNSRHAGESIVDLSTVSPAILVLFVVMMYLPPHTTYFPMAWRPGREEGKKKRSFSENLVFSQLSYLAIFIIIICITERRHLYEDPLNYNVLNVVVEVISAYGNVGFSTGYSCERRLKVDRSGCQDSGIGFSGRWSDKGKLTLIGVMIFGRLKKFNMKGGQAWMIR